MADHSTTLHQASRLFAEGKAAQAQAVLQRALQRDSADPGLNESMARLLLLTGDARRGLYFAERFAAARPGSAEAQVLLAHLFTATHQEDKARDAVARALALNPAHPEARLYQIQALYREYRLHEMVEACLDGLRLLPDHPEFSINLSNAYLLMGRGDDAVAILQRAIAANPGNHNLTTALCAAINYATTATPRQVFGAHAQYGKVLAGLMLPRPPRPRPNTDPERTIRIGIQSPDLKAHPVAVFLESFLPHLPRQRLELVAYFTGLAEDGVSARLKPQFNTWRHFTGLREQDMAQQIIADRIDILIELAGHFAGHRLPSCHLKPAPIIATYLGYPNTTGVPAVDYRIVDSLTDAPGGAEPLATEKLLRLDPCFLCYKPPADAPAVDPVPPSQRAGGGGVTFGSFNSLQKINDPLARVWKRIVEAVPGSRLLIKTNALKHEVLRAGLADRFAAAGFPMDRLELLPPTDAIPEHLAAYNRVDVALDAFPYCGTTTTCEALLMGVPVVSLASPPQPDGMHAGRVGLSLLTNSGAPELVARSVEEYIALAAGLAADPPRLAELRRTLRPQLLASPLCDGRAFGHRFEAALRRIWQDYCRNPT